MCGRVHACTRFEDASIGSRLSSSLSREAHLLWKLISRVSAICGATPYHLESLQLIRYTPGGPSIMAPFCSVEVRVSHGAQKRVMLAQITPTFFRCCGKTVSNRPLNPSEHARQHRGWCIYVTTFACTHKCVYISCICRVRAQACPVWHAQRACG